LSDVLIPRSFPENLVRLHRGEEQLRQKALDVLSNDHRLQQHPTIIECVMDLIDMLRQYETDEENMKVVQILGMRVFNAFAVSVKLTLSGYSQNAALVLRDILETYFLIDLFSTAPEKIEQWRNTDRKTRLKEFKPIKVRELLDERDGFTELKRAAHYELFSELAGHASMQSVAMLRPQGMEAQIGPFIDPTALEAVLSEAGRLAIGVGEVIDSFFPYDWVNAMPQREQFAIMKRDWLATFYPRL
jgi:hypothetical protein